MAISLFLKRQPLSITDAAAPRPAAGLHKRDFPLGFSVPPAAVAAAG